MRIYLDEDVPRPMEKHLRDKGHLVFHALDLPVHSVPDQLHYVHAVCNGADLVITCNNGRSAEARKGNFVRQVEEHLGVREKDLPVPVYGLSGSDTGNHWPKLEQRWAVHERQIEHHARQLEHTNHEKRRAEAIDRLNELLRTKQQERERRQRERGPEQEHDR